jgi:hypothetical protein
MFKFFLGILTIPFLLISLMFFAAIIFIGKLSEDKAAKAEDRNVEMNDFSECIVYN